FSWLQELGGVDDDEMDRVFNMGVGLTLVVRQGSGESIQNRLSQQGLASWNIGSAVAGSGVVRWT
ncbi:MAG: AIR synthase-related protein, partial [Planctomycetota bacterium]